MSRQTAEVRAQIPAASGRDTTPPELAIVSPTRQHWSQHPRIVVASASPPTASFAATPTAGAAPLRVAFDADASTDADGAVVRWEWTFGDGSTGLGRKVSKTYNF